MPLGDAWPLIFVLGPLAALLCGLAINLLALGVLKLLKVGEHA